MQTPLIALATTVLIVFALYFGKPVLMPLALAVLLSFLLSPVAEGLHRLGLGRNISVVFIVLFSVVLFAAGAYGIASQINALAGEIPAYKDNIREKVLSLRQAGKGGTLEGIQKTFRELKGELKKAEKEEKAAEQLEAAETASVEDHLEAENPMPVVVQEKAESGWALPSAFGPLLEMVATLGLVIVLVIFMLLRRRDLRNRFIMLCGYTRMPTTTRALDEAGERISRYLLMQTIINTTFGLAAGIGLSLVGLPYALLWGFLSALLRFIPYVGPWLGAALPVLLSLAVFPGWLYPLIIIGIYLILELTANMVLEPMLYGQSVGVSEVALLVAVAFWTWIWGGMGLALATPLTVCLVVLAKYVPGMRPIHIIMGDEPGLEPRLLFYQRLLALDLAEAREVAGEYLKTHTLTQLLDDLLLPALIHAKKDSMAGDLHEETLTEALSVLEELVSSLEDREEKQLPSAPVRTGAPILAIPTEDKFDELSVLMLKRIVPTFEINLTSPDALSGEIITQVEHEKPTIVYLASVTPGQSTEMRHLIKRIQTRFPSIKITASKLGLEDKRLQSLKETLGISISGSFAETRNVLTSLSQLTPNELPERGRISNEAISHAAQHN